jgi:hypothetical protein
MCDTPKQFRSFQPYAGMIKAGWKLSDGDFDKCFEQGQLIEFYDYLIKSAGLNLNADKFFDKTPIYMKDLGACLERADFIEKAVVITRDPRSVFVSWAKRMSGSDTIEDHILNNLKEYSQRYNRYFVGAMAERYNPRVMFVSFEDLCINPVATCQALGFFVGGQRFSHQLLSNRFDNVEKSINPSKVTEYDSFLSGSAQRSILDACSLSALFFFSNSDRIEYRENFERLDSEINKNLERYDLKQETIQVGGAYFNPWLYLCLNRRVLEESLNPMEHFTASVENL